MGDRMVHGQPPPRAIAVGVCAMRAGRAAIVVALLLSSLPMRAWAGAATDIVRVDEFIDAPRIVFGDSLAAVVGRLGLPLAEDRTTRGTFRDPTVLRQVRRLTYAGMRLEVQDRLVAAEITAPGRGLPLGLDVGIARAVVEATLGEAQDADDDRLLYLYSDGFPKTVTFHLRDGRVRKIEWEYWVD